MKNLFITCCLLTLFCVTSCTSIEPEVPANAHRAKAYNLTYTNEGRTVYLKWNLDIDTTMCGIQITCNGENPMEIDTVVTNYTIRHVVPNKDILYTVKVRYCDSLVSEGTSIPVHIRYDLPICVGYVMSANTIEELPDDDERAAAQWFDREYVQKGKGRWIPINELGSVDLDVVNCLWIHIDRQGMSPGWENLSGGFNNPAFIANLKAYVIEGGNLFLSVHATQLVDAIGRIPSDYRPNEVSTGQGGLGNDTWTINAWLGAGEDVNYDHRAHAFYQGMTLDYYNGYAYTSFPLASAGVREDHNSLWNLSSMKFPSGANKVRGWELATNSTALGTWGQNTELNYIGLVDFATSNPYKGRIIAMGMGCYEWAKQDGNLYQYQIEKLTENILETIRQ